MSEYRCEVCQYIYDEDREGMKWSDLPEDWVCPVCESQKNYFAVSEKAAPKPRVVIAGETSIENEYLTDLSHISDETEPFMADIHKIAETGVSISEPMRTKEPVISWDDILLKGAQLSKIPLNHDAPVNVQTIIGPRAKQPLIIETPVYISHMSFGALSKEAHIALSRGSAMVRTAMCSGEGGILPESLESAYKFIFEYVPNQYSVTEENLKTADAVEIKFGQSAKPGMGGHLPGEKVTEEIARIRGFKKGVDIISPSHFKDILNQEDLKKRVEWLRDASEGKPIGIKIAAGNIEKDLETALFANPDFITIDGRAGGTGSAPKFVKMAVSVPSVFSLYRARKFLDEKNASHVSLVITGGLRVSSDFAKALAMGADAIAIATSALIAIGCKQYRVCNTGKCPMGITTQDPSLRARLNSDRAAKGLNNFLKVSTLELQEFARLTGNDDVHKLSLSDLCTTNSEISDHTDIEHV